MKFLWYNAAINKFGKRETMEAKLKSQMPETRVKILELLKLNGPMTADQLSKELGISSMGTRQHLKALEHEDFIEHERHQKGMGRPSYVYSLTELGDELFPRTYLQMTHNLLDAIRDLEGEEGIDRIFAKRTEKLQSQYETRLDGKSLRESVEELAKIRTEEGYMADWEEIDEDTYLLQEHNCSICQIASQCSQACSYELKLFKRVLSDTSVKREEHMIKGDRMCTYRIERVKSSK